MITSFYNNRTWISDGYAYQTQTNTLKGGVQQEINNIVNTLGPSEIIVEAHNIDITTLQSEVSLLNSINFVAYTATLSDNDKQIYFGSSFECIYSRSQMIRLKTAFIFISQIDIWNREIIKLIYV